jgi:MOSC domain-containing protein YiiM
MMPFTGFSFLAVTTAATSLVAVVARRMWRNAETMARVSNLFIATEHRKPMKSLEEADAIADRGLAGCIHARPGGKRQVLLVDGETLAQFNLTPGILRENITTIGLSTTGLIRGQRIAIGGALLEVTVPCEPCHRMDEIRMGLQEALKDMRGVLCRVIQGGRISRGDKIVLVESTAPTSTAGGAS